MKEEEGECGGDKDGGQVALLKVSNVGQLLISQRFGWFNMFNFFCGKIE